MRQLNTAKCSRKAVQLHVWQCLVIEYLFVVEFICFFSSSGTFVHFVLSVKASLQLHSAILLGLSNKEKAYCGRNELLLLFYRLKETFFVGFNEKPLFVVGANF